MDIKAVHPYKKGVDEFYKFFTDSKTVTAKIAGLGQRNLEIMEAKKDGDVFIMKTKREIPASVPALLQKFLGAWNTVIQTEKWTEKDGARKCDMVVDLVGVPVTVTSNMNVVPKNAGCENHVDFKIKCGIPFIGGKLADFIGGLIQKSMDEEFVYITDAMAKAKKK